jgi:hypothetical protein
VACAFPLICKKSLKLTVNFKVMAPLFPDPGSPDHDRVYTLHSRNSNGNNVKFLTVPSWAPRDNHVNSHCASRTRFLSPLELTVAKSAPLATR